MSVATTPEPAAVLGELTLHRLLVAIDGSANAELALTAAITAARRDNATITLISVGPDLSTGPAAWSVPVAGTLDQGSVDEDLCKRLRAVTARIPSDIAVHTLYRRGKPGPEIVKAAKEGDYDAIILGARGVGRVGALMGSVSSHVLHHADIAVFVAHAPKE
ncbi:universal stress protein [Solirubrobacter soli]|uniref:universal stress protein n=1 Tax=Solirubrobacter soli TaxID=363832 RepID=UPI0004234CDA|nr:universal stress protein [Solirubrobacter soli]